MTSRDMTLEEAKKVIDRKNDEIAFLTRTLADYMQANNFAKWFAKQFPREVE